MFQHRITRLVALTLVAGAVAAPAASAMPAQDLRNPDNRVATPAEPRQDLRSPDARDAAAGRGTFNAPDVVVVKVKDPQPAAGGIDWGDAGIGAGGIFGVALIALGGTLVVMHRRQAPALTP